MSRRFLAALVLGLACAVPRLSPAEEAEDRQLEEAKKRVFQ